MKHLIVINNAAGKNATSDIKEKIKNSFQNLDYEVYETTGPRTVIKYLHDYLINHKDDTVRVYACGGDGTINEVLNGLVGFTNAEMAIMPVGTGNDFVKIYGAMNDSIDEYRDFKPLIENEAKSVDISKITGPTLDEPLYSINVINIGFDAMVGAIGNQNKIKGKKDPYGFTNAIVPALIHGRFNKVIVSADGKPLNDKKLLLSSISQGQWIGGEYHCSPKSDNTDGLMDVVVLKTTSLIGLLAKLFTPYKKGEILDNPKFKGRYYYARSQRASIDAPKDIDICIDGEMLRGSHFDIECLHNAVKIVPPCKK